MLCTHSPAQNLIHANLVSSISIHSLLTTLLEAIPRHINSFITSQSMSLNQKKKLHSYKPLSYLKKKSIANQCMNLSQFYIFTFGLLKSGSQIHSQIVWLIMSLKFNLIYKCLPYSFFLQFYLLRK